MGVKQFLEKVWGDTIWSKSAGSFGFLDFPDQKIFQSGAYTQLVKEGYKGNAVVYACTQRIIKSFNQAPFRIHKTSDQSVDPKSKYRALIKTPNPYTTEYNLWSQMLASLVLAGISYTYKARDNRMDVAALWQLRPDLVHPVIMNGYVVSYELGSGRNKQIIAVEDMIVVKYPDPENPFRGLSPLMAAVRDVATDNEATSFKLTTLMNKAMNPGIIISAAGKLAKDMRDRFLADWKQRFSRDKMGLPAIIEAGAMDIKSLALNMQELDIKGITNVSEARICAVLDVPPILVGLTVGLDSSSYNNITTLRKVLHEDVIIPLQNMVDDEFNKDLVQEFGTNEFGKFDNSKVPALADNRKLVHDQAIKAWNDGLITKNEARVKIGEATIDDSTGDEFKPAPRVASQSSADKSIKFQMEDHYKQSAGPDGLGLLDEAIGRRNNAEKHLAAMENWAIKEFRLQRQDVQKLFNDVLNFKQTTPLEDDALKSGLSKLDQKWINRSAESSELIFGTMLGEAMESSAAQLGIKFDLSSEFQQEFIRDYRFKFAESISKTSVGDIRQIIIDLQRGDIAVSEVNSTLKATFTRWTTVRAEMVARTEVIRSNNRGAENVWKSEGIGVKEWLPAGDACAWCESMNGKQTAVGSNYFDQGQNLTVTNDNGEEQTMKFNYEEISAPPLHPNCRCVLIPVI